MYILKWLNLNCRIKILPSFPLSTEAPSAQIRTHKVPERLGFYHTSFRTLNYLIIHQQINKISSLTQIFLSLVVFLIMQFLWTDSPRKRWILIFFSFFLLVMRSQNGCWQPTTAVAGGWGWVGLSACPVSSSRTLKRFPKGNCCSEVIHLMRRCWWEKTFSGKVWPESCKETQPGRQSWILTKTDFMHPQLQGWRWAGPDPQALWAEQSLWSRDLSSHTQTHPQNSYTVGLTFCCYHLEIHNTFWQVALHFYFALGPADCVASPACRASENRNFTWSCWAKAPWEGRGPSKVQVWWKQVPQSKAGDWRCQLLHQAL